MAFKKHATNTQFEKLITHIEGNKEMIRSVVTPSSKASDRDVAWEECAGLLNAIPHGSKKSGKGWKKTWQDFRRHARSKKSTRLTPIEKRALVLIREECAVETEQVPNLSGIIIRLVPMPEPDDMKESPSSSSAITSSPTPVRQKRKCEDLEDQSTTKSDDESHTVGTTFANKLFRINESQREQLVTFIEGNKQMITSTVTSVHDRDMAWTECAKLLNAIPSGAQKSVKGWKQAFQYLRCHARSKKSTMDLHQNRFGEPSNLILTPNEKRVLALIGEECPVEKQQVPDLSGTILRLVCTPELDDTKESPSSSSATTSSPTPVRQKRKREDLEEQSTTKSDDESHTVGTTFANKLFRINESQREQLITLIEGNKELITSVVTPSFTANDRNAAWEECAELLNTIPSGAKKDGKGWKKVFQDLKRHARSMKSTMDLHQNRFGEPSNLILTPNDKRVLALIGEQCPVEKQQVPDLSGTILRLVCMPEFDDTKESTSSSSSVTSLPTPVRQKNTHENLEDQPDDEFHTVDTTFANKYCRINESQREQLIMFIEGNKELITSVVTPSFTANDRDAAWEECAGLLNAIPHGAKKSGKGWKKAFQDFKRHAHSKKYTMDLHQSSTGEPLNLKLTPSERKVLALIGEECPVETPQVPDLSGIILRLVPTPEIDNTKESPSSSSQIVAPIRQKRKNDDLVEYQSTSKSDDEWYTVGTTFANKLCRMNESQRDIAELLCNTVLLYGLQGKLSNRSYVSANEIEEKGISHKLKQSISQIQID